MNKADKTIKAALAAAGVEKGSPGRLAAVQVRQPERAILETPADEQLRAALWGLACEAGGTIEVDLFSLVEALKEEAFVCLEMGESPGKIAVRAMVAAQPKRGKRGR